MQLLEHDAKRLAQTVGLDVPKGYLAGSPAEAAAAAFKLSDTVVIKAQVPVGGRGKAGGVVVTERKQAETVAAAMLGRRLHGFMVESVLVEEYVNPSLGIYLAVTIDPRSASPMLMLGLNGGVEINRHADKVARIHASVLTGVRSWHVWQAASLSGIDAGIAKDLVAPMQRAYRLFLDTRAELVEINPLLIQDKSRPIAADVKIVVPGADARDGSFSRLRDGFDLIELDPTGLVGLISTGAGASMLLVDLLGDAGVRPINFCDIRTGSLHGKPDRLIIALKSLGRYPNLRCVAVNVFAGITDLAEFVELLLVAIKECSPNVPLVIRVEGLGSENARDRLRAHGLICAESIDDLQRMITETVNYRPVGKVPNC